MDGYAKVCPDPIMFRGQTRSFQEAVSEGLTTVSGLNVHVDMHQLFVELVVAVDVGTHGLTSFPSDGFPCTKVVVFAIDQVLV